MQLSIFASTLKYILWGGGHSKGKTTFSGMKGHKNDL